MLVFEYFARHAGMVLRNGVLQGTAHDFLAPLLLAGARALCPARPALQAKALHTLLG